MFRNMKLVLIGGFLTVKIVFAYHNKKDTYVPLTAKQREYIAARVSKHVLANY